MLSAEFLGLSQQYMEWTLKKKVEDLIRTKLTIDNVATYYDVATQFEAKVYKMLRLTMHHGQHSLYKFYG